MRLDLIELKRIYKHLLGVEIYPFLKNQTIYLSMSFQEFYTPVFDSCEEIRSENLPELFVLSSDEKYFCRVDYVDTEFGGFRASKLRRISSYPEKWLEVYLTYDDDIVIHDTSYDEITDERLAFRISLTVLINLLWFIWNLDRTKVESTRDFKESIEHFRDKLRKYGDFWKAIEGFFSEVLILRRLI